MPNLHLAFVFWQPFLGYALFCVVRLKKVNFILKKKKVNFTDVSFARFLHY